MTDLQVRRVRFDFASADVPFNWQPERPAFAMQCNAISFFAPGFEKLIVDATREAIPLMRDPAAAEEAESYLRQEAQHSAAHQSHIRALIRRWPGLQETMDEVVASYDRLTATKPLAWRLAYPAVVEATFTPYFKVFLDHEDKLFRAGDERVASLFLWHFVEEIEHRSSALIVYNAVHDSYLYRAKTIVGVLAHMNEILGIISRGFQQHVPKEDGGELGQLLPNGLSARAVRAALRAAHELTQPGQSTYAGVPRGEVLAMIAGLIRSQGPRHNPEHEIIPEFASKWIQRYAEEPKSAARWYSVGAVTGSDGR
ncbi:metal-dependent hydrolase [Mycobacterium sp. 852002-53434_SCH5985345]|uniref:metal-dependent hydrolase n=1 Tax=unclassified Mycobacterium TaxID=2642494 RepID=UPI0007FBE086|nr:MULTISPECIES: metal-dependent hydrolase [unclassified Mycobacterium]OBF59446.1 metal-dependent hydrolase [Mycobacterium sp. 852002-53434_SCH5985345]OBF77483.1 metal-dependent hydrolase [Mycobacterium sp. 852002-51613_SCH5001154]OBF90336.1 metal-dependent hydrolase [Mycobacterium sp. 852014-52450_SCH5900713]